MERADVFKKAYLLAGLAVILLILAARFAFWPTWQAYRTNQHLSEQSLSTTNITAQPGYLKRKNDNLGNILKSYAADTIAYRNKLLQAVSTLAEEARVEVIEVPTDEQSSYYKTWYYRIQKVGLEGDAKNLINFLNRLEKAPHIGILRSANYNIRELRTSGGTDRKVRLYVYLETKV